MRLPRRAARPPEEVRARLDLPRGERVLAFADADGTWLLGTRVALYLVAPHHVRRIAWDAVENAGWDVETSRLEVSEVGEWGRPRPAYAFHVGEPGRLLELLRERVSASVLLQRRVVVADRRGFALHARRSPADGSVSWHVEYDDGVDPADVRAQVGLALAEARAEVEP